MASLCVGRHYLLLPGPVAESNTGSAVSLAQKAGAMLYSSSVLHPDLYARLGQVELPPMVTLAHAVAPPRWSGHGDTLRLVYQA